MDAETAALQPGPETEPEPTTIERLLLAGFPTTALLAGMRLELFGALADGPHAMDAVAARLGLRSRRLRPLLCALEAAGLVARCADGWSNQPEAQRWLVPGRPGYMGDLHDIYADLYDGAFRAAESLETGIPQARHDFGRMDDDRLRAFLRGSHPGALDHGRRLAAGGQLDGVRHLLDVGGGSGGLALAAVEARPGLRATVVDLPGVIPHTRAFIDGGGAGERVDTASGDILRGPPPLAGDRVVLRNLVQLMGPDDAATVIAHAAAAVEPGGHLTILGYVLDDDRVSPPETVAFNLVYISFYPDGEAYTESEYRQWCEAAGLTGFRRVPMSRGLSRIDARRPA